MEIEILLAGDSAKWVLNQPRIRIGRDPRCEVNLPGARYPALATEHVTLETVNDTVKLVNVSSLGTFLNDNPASEGFVVRSGDVLRLGPGGPELSIRLTTAAADKTANFEATRVMQPDSTGPGSTRVITEPEKSGPGSTRVMAVDAGRSPQQATRAVQVEAGKEPHRETTRVIPPQGSAAASATPPAVTTPVARFGYSSDPTPRPSVAVPLSPQRSSPTPAPAPRRPNFSANAATGVSAGSEPNRVPEPRPSTAVRTQQSSKLHNDDEEDMEMLESKLKGMRVLLIANLVILVAMLAWVFQLSSQLSATQKELREMHAQVQTAVGQFTPALDKRLEVFETRMDGLDQKLKNAQEQMVSSVDAKMKSVEDRMVERMNTEIPAMLDKYINKKLAEVKH
jgi:pSer/pThr/pTyr-binding forkhead associated (FHA) protein